MNLSAPVKTLATLLVVAFLLPMAPMLHAQTRLPPDGHLRLIVHNGTGDGDSYYVGQTVPVGAQTPSGFEFVKWFKIEGDGSLSAPLQADGNFIMGSDNSEIAATFAKLESWFPPGPEGNTKGLLLPKPQSGQARRLEQRLRVTLNRGSSARPPYSEVWGALRVKMKWKEATYVRFFTAETGGQEIANEDVLPKDSFKPKAENVYEASIWYEGNLTQEQIAQMSQSGNTPKVTIQMNFVVEGNDKPICWTGTLLPVQVITINTFIPHNNVDDPGNMNPFGNDHVFEGDNRMSGTPARATWNKDGSHRTQQRFNVIPFRNMGDADGLEDNAYANDPDGVKNDSWLNHVGATHRYHKSSSLDASGNLTAAARADTTLGDAHLKVAEATASSSGMSLSPTWLGDHKIKIRCVVSVGNPLAPSVGGNEIDYDCEITIDYSNASDLRYSLEGDHDGFPAYEVYIGNKRIFQHDPLATGESLGSLFDPLEHDVNEATSHINQPLR